MAKYTYIDKMQQAFVRIKYIPINETEATQNCCDKSHLKDKYEVEREDWGFLTEVLSFNPILIYNKERTAMLTHDDQELGVEGREGSLERVAGVEIVESRHAIFSKSGQFVPAGSPGVWL